MTYERYRASSVMIKSPAEQYRSDWQALIDQQIDNAYNWYDIEIEENFGTQVYISDKVRLGYAVNPGTGTKLSDDWKQLIFKSPTNDYIQMGRRFKYGNNVWLTINTEAYGSATENCIIRRCNNTLNTKLADGTIHKEPCAIDNDLKYGNIYFNNSVNVPQGTVSVWIQFNNFTKNILVNDRFIIGYNQVYKVKSVINYLSDFTFSPDGSPIIKLEMQVDSILSSDDFVNRVTQSTETDKVSLTGEILVTPDINTVSQGRTVSFNCKYYINSVAQSNTFVFSVVDTGVPSANYTFTQIDGQNFSIRNNAKYIQSKLRILCKDSVTSTLFKYFDIEMGGVY